MCSCCDWAILVYTPFMKTSASLNFTVLNPKGRIWTMVAGGGASVIYADTVGDLGFAAELGNYAEYSGAPNEEEVLQYARVMIDTVKVDLEAGKILQLSHYFGKQGKGNTLTFWSIIFTVYSNSLFSCQQLCGFRGDMLLISIGTSTAKQVGVLKQFMMGLQVQLNKLGNPLLRLQMEEYLFVMSALLH